MPNRPETSPTFVDAIRTCFIKYADFGGCASRSEFWWFNLFVLVASLALSIINDRVSLAFTIATLLPGVSVTTRRLHDTDRSGWWQLLWFLPIIGWLFLIIWNAEHSKPNRYQSSDTF